MSRHVFIVARDQVDLYDYLREEFSTDNVEIILDRRQGNDRDSAGDRRVEPGDTDAGARRTDDRRTRASVDTRLGSLGYAMLYVD